MEYIIKTSNKKDYLDVVKLGYPFDNKFLFLNGMDLRRLLYGKELVGVTAYIPKINKSVGFVKIQEINDGLWGIWGTYVAPEYRRMGIASALYEKAFNILKEKKVEKCIGSVSHNNMPSIENLRKTWDGFLDKSIYLLNSELNLKNIKLKRILKNDSSFLYSVYKNNVGENWIKMLNIKETNFLDRIFGSANCESYNNSLLRNIFLPIKTYIIKEDAKILGYYTKVDVRLGINTISNLSTIIKKHIFINNIENINYLVKRSDDVLHYIGGVEDDMHIIKNDINILDKFYICYKYIA